MTRDSLLVRAPDSWSKGCEFEFRQERRENFLRQSQLCVLTLIWCPFHPCVTAVIRKRPRSFCKSASGRLHLNMHTPLTQRSRSGLTMPLSRRSVGTYPETSSHATYQETLGHSCLSLLTYLWTDPGLKSGISVRALSPLKRQQQKGQAGNELSNILQKILVRAEKATITTISSQ